MAIVLDAKIIDEDISIELLQKGSHKGIGARWPCDVILSEALGGVREGCMWCSKGLFGRMS